MGHYKNGAWINDEDIIDEQEISIDTLRRRVHVTYVSPFKAHFEEDYSLYVPTTNNAGQVQKIELDIQKIKPYLKIFDSENNILEFHRTIDDYYTSSNGISENDSDELFSSNIIDIELPPDKGLFPETFKTVYLDYYQFTPSHIGNTSNIFIPLNVAAHTHIFVEKPSIYDWTYFIIAYESTSQNIIPLKNLEESKFIIISYNKSQIEIESKALIENCVLSIDIIFHLYKDHRYWLQGGIILGILGFILNICLIFSLISDKIKIILPLSTIILSYLLIAKGWLFSKDLDRLESAFDFSIKDNNIKISYDLIYLILIGGIVVTIAGFLIFLIITDP